MDEAADERVEAPGSLGGSGRPPRPGIRGISGPIFVLEHAQDLVTVVVGLALVILFVLSEEKLPGAPVLALLIAMVAVFILGLIAVNRFDRAEDPDSAGP